MRILCIAPIYLNTRRVASQRARALSQMLAQRGNEVTVLTAAVTEEESSTPPPGPRILLASTYDSAYGKAGGDLPLGTRVLVFLSVLPTDPLVLGLRVLQANGLPERLSAWAKTKFDALNNARFTTANTVKGLVEGRRWAKDAFGILKNEGEEAYDVVFSTFGPLASIWAAERVIRGGLAEFWVSDFRDALAKSKTFPWVQIIRLSNQRRGVRKANLVTAVSEGVRKSLLSPHGYQKYADKTFVVTNGYLKREDNDQGTKARSADNGSGTGQQKQVIKLAYVGQLYPGKSRPEMLFDALKTVAETNPSTKFEFHYAGGQSPLVRDLANQAGIADLLVDHGFVSHDKALELQRQSDALLVLAWNEIGNEGVLSAKFFEYMAAEKPMIALISGGKPDSELAAMVEEMNLGVAAEYVKGPSETAKVARFLESLVETKRSGGSSYIGDPDKVARFDYRNIAEYLENLINTQVATRPATKEK